MRPALARAPRLSSGSRTRAARPTWTRVATASRSTFACRFQGRSICRPRPGVDGRTTCWRCRASSRAAGLCLAVLAWPRCPVWEPCHPSRGLGHPWAPQAIVTDDHQHLSAHGTILSRGRGRGGRVGKDRQMGKRGDRAARKRRAGDSERKRRAANVRSEPGELGSEQFGIKMPPRAKPGGSTVRPDLAGSIGTT
jgi:hypothetical protein